MKKSDFAEQLRMFREQAGISQSELARRAKLNSSHLNRIESGERFPPRRKTIEAIAHALLLLPEEINRLLFSAGYATNQMKLSAAIFGAPPLKPNVRKERGEQLSAKIAGKTARFIFRLLSSPDIGENERRLLGLQIESFAGWLVSENRNKTKANENLGIDVK